MDSDSKENIYGLSAAELAAKLPVGTPDYRAGQIAAWIYGMGVYDFKYMTNLPQKFRLELAASFSILPPGLKARQESADGKTTKYLLSFPDKAMVEAVLMRQPYGNSVCLSTQVGCNMGCSFCASTLRGLKRNLTAGEILGEVLFINEELRSLGQKVDTVVLMGSGEPLLNYGNVMSFLRLVHEDYTLGLGYRHITLSTCGIVPGIYALAAENLPLGLAISLHAPRQSLRDRLMPVSRKYSVAEVAAAGKYYAERTGRQVTYEYILIAGVNDGREEAEELAKLLGGQSAHVNLIPFNPVTGKEFRRPAKKQIKFFADCLSRLGLSLTLRREMGTGIDAACGQLRNRELTAKEAF